MYKRQGSYKAEINLETLYLQEGDICMINSGELHLLEGIGSHTLHDALIYNQSILGFSYEDEMQEKLIHPLLSHKLVLPRIIHPSDTGYKQLNHRVEHLIEPVSYTHLIDWSRVNCATKFVRVGTIILNKNRLKSRSRPGNFILANA